MSTRITAATIWASCIIATSLWATGDVFIYLKTISQGDQISVQWRTTNEQGIHSFEIERKSDEVVDFRRIGRVDAKGNSSLYEYIDNGAFFKSEAGKHFTYRIKAVGANGDIYSPVSSASHEVSSVRRSWGMIKELFR
jgi:hypothetical protein